VLAAAIEELAVGAQHCEDAWVGSRGEECLVARFVFGFDHGHGLSSSVEGDDIVEVVVVDADVALGDDAAVDAGVSSNVVDDVDAKSGFSAGWAGATRAQLEGGWADQRPKTGGRSRPPCGPAVRQRRAAGPLQP